jgi:formamidopyrimidine-DNA glycosylase
MPELPEVETIARGLEEVLPGRKVKSATLTAPDLYRAGSEPIRLLRGGTVVSVERMGKALLVRLRMAKGPQRALVVHLGMTGRFVVPAPGIRPEAGVRKHRHGRIVFEDGGEIWYVDPRRFGYIFVGGMDGLRDTLNIGPDPFEIRPRMLAATLRHRSAPVKSLLLNQKLIAGLGNIYVDESLFGARVHPLTPGDAVAADAGELLAVIRRVLRRAIRHRGTTLRDYRTLDGESGAFQLRLSAYGREGEPCRRCSCPIERIVLGGRSTHFCPRCQPLRKVRAGKRVRERAQKHARS